MSKVKPAKLNPRMKKAISKIVDDKVHDEIENQAVGGSISNVAVTNVITANLLNGISQGTDYFNRKGVNIRSRFIRIAYSIHPGNNASLSPIFRVMVVRDNQSNQIAINDIDLFQLPTAGVSYLSAINFQQRHRYDILFDKLHVLKNQGVSATTVGTSANTASETITNVLKLNLRNRYTRYVGTGNLIGQIQKGALYFIILSDTVTGGLNGATYYMNFLHQFEDA